MQIRDSDGSEELSLNMAPMIDIVFLLLIFFMVTTTFRDREKQMDIELPLAQSGESPEREPDEVVINVGRDGRIYLGQAELPQEDLLASLTRTARHNPETPVTIRGHREAFHEHVVSVMDTCRRAGLTNLGIMTDEL
ncbi:MAG: biopolymer transport protein ExbD [Chlamydiales bacterium]|jgi:biopolymer transport protein ExbD